MKRSVTLLTVLMVLFSCLSYGQKNKNIQKQYELAPVNLEEMNGHSATANSSLKNLFNEVKGTFQIQISDSNYKPLLSQNIYNLIIEKRQLSQDVFISIDDKSILYLPSKTKIQKHDFKPLEVATYKLNN